MCIYLPSEKQGIFSQWNTFPLLTYKIVSEGSYKPEITRIANVQSFGIWAKFSSGLLWAKDISS